MYSFKLYRGFESHSFLYFFRMLSYIIVNECSELYFLNLQNSLLYFEFLPILIFLVIAIVLAVIIVSLSYILAIQNPETEKLSTYECGFEPYEDARNIFDVKFYLVAILFIIFDIETMFLLPWSVSLSQLSCLGFWSMVDFIIELGVGFVYVWYIGALEWD
uniref:NADH dehydrogenase subunit 3 n=1 Tax=Hemiaulus sinensis TaxID=1003062 RepID=UPI002027E9A3|nr:NADH dehydrogenase subunit 3 [Hemiaulus sinensis]QYB23207.1 NADH dehydrogenase subunit 3 [Hemiaulus sinensis]